MRTRTRVALIIEMLHRSWRVSPVASTIIVLAQNASTSVVAALQRHLVDQAGTGTALAAVVGTVLGLAVANAASAAGNRVHGNLTSALADRVDIDLNTDLTRWAATTPHLDVYNRPDFLNQLHLVRSGTYSLAQIPWVALRTAAGVAGLAASLILLFQVSPWLVLMAVLAVAPLLLGQRSARIIRRAREVVAPMQRQEAALTGLANDPEQAKELRVSHNEDVLDTLLVQRWEEIRSIVVGAEGRAAVQSYLGWVIYAAGYLAAVGLTILLVSEQRATVGDLVLVITLGQQLRWQVNGTVWGVSALNEGGDVTHHYDALRRHAQAALPRRAGVAVHQLTAPERSTASSTSRAAPTPDPARSRPAPQKHVRSRIPPAFAVLKGRRY